MSFLWPLVFPNVLGEITVPTRVPVAPKQRRRRFPMNYQKMVHDIFQVFSGKKIRNPPNGFYAFWQRTTKLHWHATGSGRNQDCLRDDSTKVQSIDVRANRGKSIVLNGLLQHIIQKPVIQSFCSCSSSFDALENVSSQEVWKQICTWLSLNSVSFVWAKCSRETPSVLFLSWPIWSLCCLLEYKHSSWF